MNSSLASIPLAEPRKISVKVFGIGGAGVNAAQHMAQQAFPDIVFAAINTDAQSLAASSLTEKIILGAKLTRGLGAGGDPEMGKAAAMEDLEKIKSACAGADMIFITAGLGGGTGTGAGPIVAQAAKESGALVLALVTIPFEFEGTRRQRQAQLGLQQLKAAADAVICVPNQKIFKLIDENTSVIDTFKISNELLAQGIRGIWRLLTQSGLIQVDFADLCAVTRGRHAESSFAMAEASGENRALHLVEKLLAHPLLDDGHALSNSDSALVSLVGGPDLTMSEVNCVMEQINRQCENAHLIFGAAIDEQFTNRISVTLIASRRPNRDEAKKILAESEIEEEVFPRPEMEAALPEVGRRSSGLVAPPPELSEERKEKLLSQQLGGSRLRKKSALRQGQLPLDIIAKGRFEKSAPTIHDGEDLDIPTYIRRGIPLN
ncbi:MAG: cell division protein FtsZ [Verrucomicrobiota bacterium]|nr:cell division protein FtsZ [Verrucomicrobiota bacterium]